MLRKVAQKHSSKDIRRILNQIHTIQMHARIEEEVIIDRASHPIQETARNLGPALLVVTFDAIFAFAALNFAKVPMIRDFALLLCIGIQFVVNGILGIATDPALLKGIRDVLQSG